MSILSRKTLSRNNSSLREYLIKFLTLVGKPTLINATVMPIVAYYMQAMSLPSSISNRINKLYKDFLWGNTDDKKKLHLIS